VWTRLDRGVDTLPGNQSISRSISSVSRVALADGRQQTLKQRLHSYQAAPTRSCDYSLHQRYSSPTTYTSRIQVHSREVGLGGPDYITGLHVLKLQRSYDYSELVIWWADNHRRTFVHQISTILSYSCAKSTHHWFQSCTTALAENYRHKTDQFWTTNFQVRCGFYLNILHSEILTLVSLLSLLSGWFDQ